MHHRARDLTGQTLGYLTALEYQGSLNGRRSVWPVRCICGTVKNMDASEFVKQQKRGVLASCGCMKKITLAQKRTTHGMSLHPAYAVWRSMVDRCRLPTHQAWARYGGRGITVCERWQQSFQNFWEDMGLTYQKGLELDRRDNNAGYSPENCRWVTSLIQNRNRRDNVYMGALLGAEIAEMTGLAKSTVYYRLKAGVTPEQMLEAPNCGRKFTT